jgi:hypothetical protein
MLFFAFSDRPSFLENSEFQLLGALVVFGALGLLWGMLEISGRIFRKMDRRSPPPKSPETLPATTSQLASDPNLPPEIIAVIAAAVHVSLKTPFRIVSIETSRHPETISQLSLHAWSVEGRRQIFDSKRVR